MSVFINESEGFFSLKTCNTEYQMRTDEYGVLKHLWYGRITGCNMEYLLDYPDAGFCGNPYDVGDRRTYSLNTLPLEYACSGTGDYRISAISVKHSDGSCALDLRYKSFSVKKGKYAINGLPAVYADDSDAETLEITLQDNAADIEVVLRYAVIEKYDIITRCAVIRNNGSTPAVIENAASFCLDFPHGDWEMMHFHGRHSMERITERLSVMHGIHEISSTRGSSSHQHNPSVIICSPDCTENSGDCFGSFFVYSGSFRIQLERDQFDQLRLIAGINPDTFSWTINPDEEFETPEVVITYSPYGLSELSHNFHSIIRNNICRGQHKLAERPILINNWEATYFDFDSEKIYNIARQAAQLGVDMLVLDDGWFGNRNSDCSGLGDWFVNENKLKGGLSQLSERIKQLGMKFGIWFEPEMVSEDSNLYRNHPEWVIRIPGRNPMRGRFQLVLDLSREDVRNYLYDCISTILRSADISYIKWDMNRSISDLYSLSLTPERQGELSHRYVLGLYSLLERLVTDFPHVLFEGCSGGGGRFDAGMLYYCPQIWCSDNTDAYERTKIQYGTSFIYPVSAVGSHISVVPNHQTGRITPLETRAVTAMAGSFGFELDLQLLSVEEKRAVSEEICRFRKYAELIHNGKYYRLSNPFEDNHSVWSFVSDDMSEVLVQGVIFRHLPSMKRKCIRLAGLEPDSRYRLSGSEDVYSGTALMSGGILLPQTWGDYSAVEFHLKKC